MDRAVVTGMPGVGKSWFVDYFAWYCIQQGDAVILECDDDTLVNESRCVELLVPKVVQSTEPSIIGADDNALAVPEGNDCGLWSGLSP